MDIGNKILDLRKKKNITQEQLEEMVGVSRQTISKWELSETAPDLVQAKKISKIFNISLDDLTNNDIKDILITKASDTEKLVKVTIIFMKVLVILIILAIIGIVALFTYFNVQVVSSSMHVSCVRNEHNFLYDIVVNDKAKKDINDMKITEFNTNDEEFKNVLNIKDYDTAQELLDYIREYNLSNNGVCE